jgi:hypothetical protein
MSKKMHIRFEDGAHSPRKFASKFLTPLFEAGVITEYPGADYYAVCYGELCAYKGESKLLACWSREVPDLACDIDPLADYKGKWKKS